MNAFYKPFGNAQKKPWAVSIPSLVECISIVQLASVPIKEIWPLGRDMFMYPPVQIIPGVVDQRWIGTQKAG